MLITARLLYNSPLELAFSTRLYSSPLQLAFTNPALRREENINHISRGKCLRRCCYAIFERKPEESFLQSFGLLRNRTTGSSVKVRLAPKYFFIETNLIVFRNIWAKKILNFVEF